MNPIKFLAWNIDQARREEKYEKTKWDNRSENVKQLINNVNADIIALIELRDLETSNENAQQFLSYFANYDKVSRRYCHYDLAFTMALLINPKKYFVGNTRIHNYHGNVVNDKMIMFIDLQDKLTLKWFTIGITHLDMEENRKWESIHILSNLMREQKYPTFIYGDYNFFDNKEGINQRQYMLSKFNDIAYPIYMKTDDGDELLSGTFIGFPHDEFKQKFENMSRLDHIFATKNVSSSKAYSPYLNDYQCDNTNYDTYNYPSDHLAIYTEIQIL